MLALERLVDIIGKNNFIVLAIQFRIMLNVYWYQVNYFCFYFIEPLTQFLTNSCIKCFRNKRMKVVC